MSKYTSDIKKRIGIYGLAANPPTLGHRHVIKSVLKEDLVDEVWVIPSYIHFHGKCMVPYEHRVNMCREAFSGMEGVRVKQFEVALSVLIPDYDGSTISMLHNLRKHRDEDYHLIIGQDNADSISTWKNGDKLIYDEKFIVIPRPSDNDFVEVMDKPMWYKYDPHTYLDGVPETNLSSTMARELCTRHHIIVPTKINELKHILDDSVVDYIIDNGIYKEVN